MLRRQAGDLLTRMLADRDASERRLSETGRRDPIKAVTGATALEKAIASTREMIAQMDLMLAQLESGIAVEANGVASNPGETAKTATVRGAPDRFRPRGMLSGKRRRVAATA
jgi:hypothetical protein